MWVKGVSGKEGIGWERGGRGKKGEVEKSDGMEGTGKTLIVVIEENHNR